MTLTERHHKSDGIQSKAVYSPCERYRYALSRTWDTGGPRLLYIMLNPSKATEAENDPTIARCQTRALRLGYGGFVACNLFGLRETDPRNLRKADAPEGPDNKATVLAEASAADLVLCAWGVHGEHRGQAEIMEKTLRDNRLALHALGLTKHGHPRHPLYVSYGAAPAPWV